MLNFKHFLNVQKWRGFEITNQDSTLDAGEVQSQIKIKKEKVQNRSKSTGKRVSEHSGL